MSENIKSALLNNSGTPIIEFALDNKRELKIIYINKDASLLLKLNGPVPAETLYISLRKRFGPNSPDLLKALVSQTFSSKQIQDSLMLSDMKTWLVRILPTGETVAACWIDVNAYCAGDWEMREKNRDLEQFAYLISHDLKEPLRMVSAYLKILFRDHLDEMSSKAQKLLDYAKDGAVRMEQMINDLLKLSRIQFRNNIPTVVDLNTVIRETMLLLRSSLRELGAVVSIPFLPRINADRTHMAQLFLNLATNSIKFRSSRKLEIRLSCEASPEFWSIKFSDNGIGIQREFRECIFDVFRRLHTNEEYPGTGMGLAICRNIVQRHNGSIIAADVPRERGAVFIIKLPR